MTTPLGNLRVAGTGRLRHDGRTRRQVRSRHAACAAGIARASARGHPAAGPGHRKPVIQPGSPQQNETNMTESSRLYRYGRHRAQALLGGLMVVGVATLLGGCSYVRLLFAPASAPPPEGASTTVRGPAYTPSSVTVRAPDPASDWGTYNRTLKGERYSPLAQINTHNVASLHPVCTFTLDKSVNMQSGPLEIGNTLYVTTLQNTYAIDASNCKLRWKHVYHLARHPSFDPNKTNRGAAYLKGRLFRGSNDGRLYALDAATGKQLWNVPVGDPAKGETFPAAPVAWNGEVFIGNAGGDNYGVSGRMMAFDAATGARLWTRPLIPSYGKARASWPPKTPGHPRGGATTWTSYTIDPKTGLLYVPTGNAAPDFLKSLRPGKNLYAYSVVALDTRTGAMRWYHQFLKAYDFHDWDMAAPPELITTPNGVHLLAAAGKDGYLYALNRDTGKQVFKTAVTRIRNPHAPPTPKGTDFCPGIDGGVEWNGPAYSPHTNAFYVNAVDWCTTVKTIPPDKLKARKGLPWTGSRSHLHPYGKRDAQRGGWLTAVNAANGTVLWKHHAPTPLIAGVTATAGGLVFTGNLNGRFMALDAKTGKVLYSHNTGQPIGGGVISYAAHGRQYVAVASGLNSPLGWKLRSNPAKIVVFAVK